MIDQRIIDLYDRFTHGGLSRREFLDRLARLAGGSAAALALLPLLQNDYARAAVVPEDDPWLAAGNEEFGAGRGSPPVLGQADARVARNGEVVNRPELPG